MTDRRNLALKFAIIASRRPQADIAEAIGVHHGILSFWVNGRRPVPAHQKAALARILKRPVSELFPEAAA